MSSFNENIIFSHVISSGWDNNKTWEKTIKLKQKVFCSDWNKNKSFTNYVFEISLDRMNEAKYSVTLSRKALCWLIQCIKDEQAADMKTELGTLEQVKLSKYSDLIDFLWARLDRNVSQLTVHNTTSKVFGLSLTTKDKNAILEMARKANFIIHFDVNECVPQAAEILYLSILADNIFDQIKNSCSACSTTNEIHECGINFKERTDRFVLVENARMNDETMFLFRKKFGTIMSGLKVDSEKIIDSEKRITEIKDNATYLVEKVATFIDGNDSVYYAFDELISLFKN